MVAAAVLLPPAYLVVRAVGDGSSAADALFRLRILEILGRTLLLVAAVSAGSVILAVPLAWLTVRTDLPFRKFWAVLTALPLVIPSYVGSFIVVLVLGPRGMLQGLLESLFGVDRLPDINGFPGAMLTLTLLSYPYVLLTVRAGLLRLDPALEESSRGLGQNAWSTFFRVILRQLRPAIAGGALLAALYTLSDFGAVSLLRYETFTSAIFVQYGSALDRTLGAAMSLVLVALALSLVAGEAFTRGGARYYTTGAGVSHNRRSASGHAASGCRRARRCCPPSCAGCDRSRRSPGGSARHARWALPRRLPGPRPQRYARPPGTSRPPGRFRGRRSGPGSRGCECSCRGSNGQAPCRADGT